MPRPESLENILNVVIRPEFTAWHVLRHDKKTESFDPLRLLQSFLESGIDLESAARLFDKVVDAIRRIAQIDTITQDRIYNMVVDALMETSGKNAQIWLANYTSIFGSEHEEGLTSSEYVNVRQRGELKRQVLLYLCEAYSVDAEDKVRALLGDEEFTLLADQLIKIVRYCGFYRVRRDFLNRLLTELAERSVKSIIPSKSFDPESALSRLRDIAQSIVLARDESQTNRTAGLNVLTTAVEDMAAILLRRFGVVTRRNTMGSLKQLADLVGAVSSIDKADVDLTSVSFRARAFPDLERIADDLKSALALHRRPVKQFWMVCEELRVAIAEEHVLRACRCAEDMLASAKLIVNPDERLATLLAYDYSKTPAIEYLEALATILDDRGFTAHRADDGEFVDVECDLDNHKLLDFGRVLRVRVAFAANDWNAPAAWMKQCIDDAKGSDEIIPVLVTNRKISRELITPLRTTLEKIGRYLAITEPKAIESILYKPERLRDLVLAAIIPATARQTSAEARDYELPPGIGVGYEREFLMSALRQADDDKGETAARDTSAFLESVIREHFCFAYGTMLSHKGGVPIELRVANGQWDGRHFWGMRAYLAWFRAAGEVAKKNSNFAGHFGAIAPSQRALTELSQLLPLRNGYAHRSREVPRVEAKLFIGRVARTIEHLVAAKAGRCRGIVVSSNEQSVTLWTESRVQQVEHLETKHPIQVGALAYVSIEPPTLTPQVLVQCEECHAVAAVPSGRKGSSYTCSNGLCRHQNFLEGMWESLVKKGDTQISQLLKPQKRLWRPPKNLKVFISYALQQQDLARQIASTLENRHADVWHYMGRIVGGDPLIEDVGRRLNSANCGVFLISREFLEKKWTRAELDVLLHKFIETRSVRIIPVRINITHEELAEAIPFMRNIVSIPLTSPQELSRRIVSIVFKPPDPA